MTPQPVCDRTDAGILLALVGAEAREESMKQDEGLTWPQIRYRRVAGLLAAIGVACIVGAPFIPLEGLRFVTAEIGVAFLIAGILAGVVEPFFREEFARDAFVAAFRYVLPSEFKDEVEKILRFELIAEKQVWSVKIEEVSDQTVRVITWFERTVRNKSKSDRPLNAWYEAEDYNFCEGPTEILECGVQSLDDPSQIHKSTSLKRYERHVEVKTAELMIKPGKTARVWGRGVQYRRTNDVMWETFRFPIVNPEIEVLIDENEFAHDIQFGTPGDYTKSEYGNRYTLSGVYFPGQYMCVRWRPKKSTTKETIACPPQLPGSVGADPAQSA